MAIEIRKVRSRRALKRFIRFPFRLYNNHKQWIPPLIKGEMNNLNRKSNPAFDHCETIFLLAYRDGKVVGRIAGIINHRYIEQWGKKDARFCWFDAIDDREVFYTLFSAVEEWARTQGMERMVGPMGFTTFERQGILVQGFDEMPTFAGSYNPPYYPEYLELQGYEKEIEYLEYELTVPEQVPEKIIKISNIVRERYGLRLLKASTTREMLPYADQVFRLLNSAYKPLYGFTELTEKQIAYFVNRYFKVIKPEYTSIVLDRDNRVLGFQISMPSLSKALQKARGRLFPFGWFYVMMALKKPERLDTLLTGVLPEYQSKGVNALYMSALTAAAIRNGIKHAESNGELEENIKVQNTWRYFQSRQHRRSRIYARQL